MTRARADVLLKEHAHYYPRLFLSHIDPMVSGFSSSGSKVSVRDSGLRDLKQGSSESMLNDPRLLGSQVIARNQSRIFKNRAAKSLYEYATKLPENDLKVKIEKPIGKDKYGLSTYGDEPNGQARIYAMVDGQRHSMLMSDELAQYWMAQDPKIAADLVAAINTMSGAPLLRAMATGYNPGFALANFPRDLFHSWFVTDVYSPVLPVAWGQQALDFSATAKDVFSRKGIVERYSKLGGSMNFLNTEGRILGNEPWETSSSTKKTIGEIGNFIGWANETSELWTRMGLMRRAMLSGKSEKEAAFIARTYLDFAQGGSWTKAADKFVPYLNAGVQGTRGIVREWKTNPGIAAFKSAQIMALGAGLAMWNRKVNEEAWNNISPREKVTKWIITTPFWYTDADGEKRYIYFGIPKDQGQRIVATIGEELMEKSVTGNSNTDKLSMAASDFIPFDVMNLMPPSMAAAYSYVFNKDFWANRDIWAGRKDISPKNEMYRTTPEAWVLWGEKTGMSPERSRRAFNKLVPQNLYTYMAEAFIGQYFGTLDDKDKEAAMKPFLAKLAESPISKRFVRQTWPQTGRLAQLREDAENLEVDLTNEKTGKSLTIEQMERKIKFAKRSRGDKRITLDREFDLLSAAASGENEAAHKAFDARLNELRENEPFEYKRITSRIKKKFPHVLGGLFLMTLKAQSNTGWENRIEFIQWFTSLPPGEKIKFKKRYGPGAQEQIIKMNDQILGVTGVSVGGKSIQSEVKSQIKRFADKMDALLTQYLEGKITKAVYLKRVDEIKADAKKFGNMLNKKKGGASE